MEWLRRVILNKYGASVIRHALTALAGFLVAWGIVADVGELQPWINQTADLLLAIIIYLLAQGASFADKKGK